MRRWVAVAAAAGSRLPSCSSAKGWARASRVSPASTTALPLANLAVTDNLPAGLTVPVGANPTSTCLGATISAPTPTQVQVSGASVPAASGAVAASCFSEIDVLVSAQGDYVNTIGASSVTGTACVSSFVMSTSTTAASLPAAAVTMLRVYCSWPGASAMMNLRRLVAK